MVALLFLGLVQLSAVTSAVVIAKQQPDCNCNKECAASDVAAAAGVVPRSALQAQSSHKALRRLEAEVEDPLVDAPAGATTENVVVAPAPAPLAFLDKRSAGWHHGQKKQKQEQNSIAAADSESGCPPGQPCNCGCNCHGGLKPAFVPIPPMAPLPKYPPPWFALPCPPWGCPCKFAVCQPGITHGAPAYAWIAPLASVGAPPDVVGGLDHGIIPPLGGDLPPRGTVD